MLSAVVGVVTMGDFVGEVGVKVGIASAKVEVELGFFVTTTIVIGTTVPQAPNRIALRIRAVDRRFLKTLNQNIEIHSMYAPNAWLTCNFGTKLSSQLDGGCQIGAGE